MKVVKLHLPWLHRLALMEDVTFTTNHLIKEKYTRVLSCPRVGGSAGWYVRGLCGSAGCVGPRVGGSADWYVTVMVAGGLGADLKTL